MKCKNCGKRMKTMLGDTVIRVNSDDVKVKNIPVFVCPNCSERFVHDVAIGRAKAYIQTYGANDGQIDFGEYEQKEAEDTITIMQTLGIL